MEGGGISGEFIWNEENRLVEAKNDGNGTEISTEYFNYTDPVIGTDGWTLTVFTSLKDPGMVYYQFDDGRPEGTPQPSYAENLSILSNYFSNGVKNLSEALGLDSPSDIPGYIPWGNPLLGGAVK